MSYVDAILAHREQAYSWSNDTKWIFTGMLSERLSVCTNKEEEHKPCLITWSLVTVAFLEWATFNLSPLSHGIKLNSFFFFVKQNWAPVWKTKIQI